MNFKGFYESAIALYRYRLKNKAIARSHHWQLRLQTNINLYTESYSSNVPQSLAGS